MISIPSFAKINLGLKIGPGRPDGFHELRTVYQTLALHDVIRVDVVQGEGIEIRCSDPRVPQDSSNTCYKIVERVMASIREGRIVATGREPQIPRLTSLARDGNFKRVAARDANFVVNESGAREGAPFQSTEVPARGKVVIEIEKRLPVQGGMGAASSNAVATMIGLERALGIELSPQEKMRIAAEVGSDVPLFLIGGTVLGIGRGEEVYPLQDLPPMHVVVVTPPIGVSTPQAFARWDALARRGRIDRLPDGRYN